MAAPPFRSRPLSIHPFRLVLLSCGFPLFLGGLLADIGYARTYEIQWTNFAAWLIAGAMVFTGLALAWLLAEAILGAFRDRRTLTTFGLVTALFIVGLFNSFMHARDAWGSMPYGLVLSIVETLLAAGVLWMGVLAPRVGGSP